MNEQAPLSMEDRIHSLLCNDLDERGRRELLLRIVRDEQARQLLQEMLISQDSARAAFGYDLADAAIDASLKRLKESAGGRDRAGDSGALSAGRQGGPPRPDATRWRWRAAAGLVLAASALGAVIAYVSSRQTRDKLDAMAEKIARAEMTAEEFAKYQRIWHEIVGPADKQEPWILLSGGGGRFEYLPASNGPGGDGRFVVLRCVVLSAEEGVMEQVNLLLPAGRPVRVSLGQAGSLAGQPIRCDVSAEKRWVGMDLRVGDEGTGTVGLQGRVPLGDRLSEIGRFKLAGRNLRVFLQALPLPGGVG